MAKWRRASFSKLPIAVKQTAPARCPECLSALAASSPDCDECGWCPPAPRPRWPLVLGALATLATVTAWWWQSHDRVEVDPPHAASFVPGEAPHTQPAVEVHESVSRERSHTMRLLSADGPRTAVLLQWDAPPHTVAFLPLSRLPLRDKLVDDAGNVPVCVGTSDAYGFVLLAGLAPRDSEPLPPAVGALPTGSILHEARTQREVTIVARTAATPHALLLDLEVDDGEVLLDAHGRAAALSLGAGSALSISPAFAWTATPRPLSELQRELRRADPALRLEDAILALRDATTVDATRVALEELELGFGAARDAAVVGAYDRALRYAHRQVATRLTEEGRAKEGLTFLRSALDRFVGDLDCLADLVPLAAAAGDLDAAADCWLDLQSRSPGRAVRHAASLGDAFLEAGRTAYPDTSKVELLARGVDVLPARADLRLAYADALLATGQTDAAVDQARLAAQLDPRLAWSHYAMLQRAESVRVGRVEVPFDPDSRIIQARCLLEGVALDLVVDTGASLTVVPAAFASRGSPSRRRVQVQTASGRAEGTLVRFRELQIGTLVVRNTHAVALDLPGTLAGKGLLGMNVLQRLDVHIDSARSVLVLQRSGTR